VHFGQKQLRHRADRLRQWLIEHEQRITRMHTRRVYCTVSDVRMQM